MILARSAGDASICSRRCLTRAILSASIADPFEKQTGASEARAARPRRVRWLRGVNCGYVALTVEPLVENFVQVRYRDGPGTVEREIIIRYVGRTFRAPHSVV